MVARMMTSHFSDASSTSRQFEFKKRRHAQPNAERRRDARQQRQRDVTKNGANAQTRDKMTTRQTAKIMNVSPGLRPVLAHGI